MPPWNDSVFLSPKSSRGTFCLRQHDPLPSPHHRREKISRSKTRHGRPPTPSCRLHSDRFQHRIPLRLERKENDLTRIPAHCQNLPPQKKIPRKTLEKTSPLRLPRTSSPIWPGRLHLRPLGKRLDPLNQAVFKNSRTIGAVIPDRTIGVIR